MPSNSVLGSVATFGQRIPAPLIVILALVLIQTGSGWAKLIMSADNVYSLTFIRLALGGLLLVLLLRPNFSLLNSAQWFDVAGLGIALTAFNVTIYLALIHLPLSLVATIGFLGPLTVSLIGAQRSLDFLWPGIAFAGVCLLTPWDGTETVSWTGIAYGIAYACAWAFYILSSVRTGRSIRGLDGFAIATCMAAVLVLPLGFSNISYFFSTPKLITMTVLIAVFATVPFSLEFIALKRLPPRTFGILLSLEPAIAAIAGIIVLNEVLAPVTWFAIGLVSAASVGATVTRLSRKSTRTSH